MREIIVVGYGPEKGAPALECRHFTDADEAARFRDGNTTCARFLTVSNPSGVRKQNPRYSPPQETAPGADKTHNLDEAGSTPAPATNSEPVPAAAGNTPPPPVAGRGRHRN